MRLSRINVLVIGIHCLVLGTFYMKKNPYPIIPSPKPLCVQEIRIAESIPSVKEEKQKEIVVQKSIPKKEKAKAVPNKTVTEKKDSNKIVTTKKEKSNTKEIRELLAQSLTQTKHESTAVKKKEITLASEKFSWTGSFDEELIAYLQEELSVPEAGVVTLQLTLSTAGKLLRMQIIQCAAASNRNYLESRLPELHYPSFCDHYPKEKERTFALTFHID